MQPCLDVLASVFSWWRVTHQSLVQPACEDRCWLSCADAGPLSIHAPWEVSPSKAAERCCEPSCWQAGLLPSLTALPWGAKSSCCPTLLSPSHRKSGNARLRKVQKHKLKFIWPSTFLNRKTLAGLLPSDGTPKYLPCCVERTHSWKSAFGSSLVYIMWVIAGRWKRSVAGITCITIVLLGATKGCIKHCLLLLLNVLPFLPPLCYFKPFINLSLLN